MYADTTIPSPAFRGRAAGKLLLTAEYFVLDGAVALAVPTKFGQSLEATPTAASPAELYWESFEADGSRWFFARFALPSLDLLESNAPAPAATLQTLLRAAQQQNPHFLNKKEGIAVETRVDFPRAWGLGTSSTLVAHVARWAEANPYRLLAASFGGSGYDLACAFAEGPIRYQRTTPQPLVTAIDYSPVFREDLYFLYLGKKQDSREGIQRYRASGPVSSSLLDEVNSLTEAWIAAKNITELDRVIMAHETLVSKTLGLARAKNLYFADLPGEVKSLGAWGGDFALVTGHAWEERVRDYFAGKGFHTLLSWQEMVLGAD
jgi:mevalonate kinase